MGERYVNCLKFSIQDELRMHRVCSIQEAYQLFLNSEEKQNWQFFQMKIGERRGTFFTSRGGFNYDKGESSQGDEK